MGAVKAKAYEGACIDDEKVEWPVELEGEVPKDVRVVLQKTRYKRGQRGKASDPPDPVDEDDADPFGRATPQAVSMESTDDDGADVNVRTGSAYMGLSQPI